MCLAQHLGWSICLGDYIKECLDNYKEMNHVGFSTGESVASNKDIFDANSCQN